jgi:hypothetical protein
MRFLGRGETSVLERKLRRQIADQPEPKTILYYESGNRDYAASANAMAGSIGEFSEAALIFQFCVTGDGWNEICADDERWQKYRRWRSANGEYRRLYGAPGHLFASNEVRQLSEALTFSFQLGWDALVTAKPGRQIYRGFQRRALVEELTSLGFWRC